MSFFKPSVFIKTFLFFCAISVAIFSISCKQLASFDPNVEGARVVVSNTISAPTGIRATNGLKRKISLEWTPVSGARYYEIYYAESATAEFTKIGETEKSSFDDKVGTGVTRYYKVCALKSNGTQSPFSITMRGASLAKPVIVGGDVKDYSVTISWFMENSLCVNGEDNYEKSLKFDVCYKTSSDSDWKEKTIDARFAHGIFLNSYEYTLTNLANAQSYQFCIKAYTIDKDSNETSNVVDKTTMISYIPLAPELKASEGTSSKEISLNITLPPMVMVRTVTNDSNGEEKDVEFPLYFEISRKLESASEYEIIVEKLYCNGTTTAPDYSNLKDTYKLDDVIEWIDEDSDLQGGVKYEYMVRSFVDVDYGKIVCPEGMNLVPPPGMFSKSVGWKSAPLVFEIDRSRFDNNGLTLSEDKTKICSVLFGFNMEWDDLGKISEYKFAIEENRKTLTAEVSDSGVTTWLRKDEGSNFFETLEEINRYEVKFGSKNGLKENEKGFYSYTLYIVPKDAELIEGKWESVLDFKKAGEVCVTDEVELPKAEFEVQGGYNDKVKLIISNFESDVRYVVTRTRMENGVETSEKDTIVLNEKSPDEDIGVEAFAYYDKGIVDNCRYSYVLEATASNGVCKRFEPQFAETLGTPKVLFEISKLDYDSFEISFKNVLLANEYEITIGKKDGFANGCNFKINMDKIENSHDGTPIVIDYNDENKVEISFSENENKFTIIVKKPYGYDMANLAGTYANASVKAFSDVDAASGSTEVRVLGPALINAAVAGGDCNDTTIAMTWDKVDGASGYLIYRIAYKDSAATEIESTDTLYYPATDDDITGSPLLSTGVQTKDIVINKSGGKYTLQDTDTPATDTSSFQKNQARISWGRPFGYIVLPVKDKGDFSFTTDTKTLAATAKVDYTKTGTLAEVKGNTYGYGMNMAASKSDSIKDVPVEWVKPNAQTGLVPTLYRRAAGTDGSFAKVKKAENLSAKDTLEGDDRYEAFEYVVKYDTKEGGDKISVPASLLAEFAAAAETRYAYPEGMAEPQNKGYALAVKLSAAIDEENTYYETITWWDYSKRSIGPEKVTLSVYNNNIKDGWVDILTADGTGSTLAEDETIDITIKEPKETGKVSVAPKGIVEGTAGTTSGMLKVLRDYKHYYKVDVTGKDRGGATFTDTVGEAKDVFAYRQITDEELVKATMLILADMVNNSKMESWSTGTGNTLGAWEDAILGADDSKVQGWQNSSNNFKWRFSNYKHIWEKMPGLDASATAFLTLSDENSDESSRGRKNGKYFLSLYKGSKETADLNSKISLSIASEPYGDATITFAADQKHFAANVIRNGKTASFSKEGLEDCRYWFPMNWKEKNTTLGTGNCYGYFGKDSKYGWWPPSN